MAITLEETEVSPVSESGESLINFLTADIPNFVKHKLTELDSQTKLSHPDQVKKDRLKASLPFLASQNSFILGKGLKEEDIKVIYQKFRSTEAMARSMELFLGTEDRRYRFSLVHDFFTERFREISRGGHLSVTDAALMIFYDYIDTSSPPDKGLREDLTEAGIVFNHVLGNMIEKSNPEDVQKFLDRAKAFSRQLMTLFGYEASDNKVQNNIERLFRGVVGEMVSANLTLRTKRDILERFPALSLSGNLAALPTSNELEKEAIDRIVVEDGLGLAAVGVKVYRPLLDVFEEGQARSHFGYLPGGAKESLIIPVLDLTPTDFSRQYGVMVGAAQVVMDTNTIVPTFGSVVRIGNEFNIVSLGDAKLREATRGQVATTLPIQDKRNAEDDLAKFMDVVRGASFAPGLRRVARNSEGHPKNSNGLARPLGIFSMVGLITSDRIDSRFYIKVMCKLAKNFV